MLEPVPTDTARAGLRALKTVTLADDNVSDLEVRFLAAVQKHILHSDVNVEELQPISPDELAQLIGDTEVRRRVLHGCVLTACIDGETSKPEVELIERYAQAFGLESHPVHLARNIAEKHLLRARIDIARRAYPGHKIKQVFNQDGLLGVLSQVRTLFGVTNQPLAQRCHALADFAPGTLGRSYYDFITSNGFPFPGEKNAAPAIIMYHDCTHVLGGYGTTPEEEVQAAAFQAGYFASDPFYGLLFGVAEFHLGIQVTPASTPETMRADPELLLRAFARGSQMTKDLSTDWDPWDHFDRKVEDLRREYNILPRE